MRASRSFQVLGLFLVSRAVADEVSCWAPDGKTLAQNNTYVPCNKLGITQEGVYSSCCRLDGDPDQRDLCTTSGLCLRDGVLSRGYCTDKTWDSPACVDVCTKESEGGTASDTVQMTSCTDGTYCCGNNNLTCCGTDDAVTIPTQASVIASNVTETALPDGYVASSYKDATIALGVLLGVSLLAAAGAIIWLMMKNKSLYKQLNGGHTPAPDTMPETSQSGKGNPDFAQPPRVDSYLTERASPMPPSEPSPGMSQHGSWQQQAGYNPQNTAPIQEVEGTQNYLELDGSQSQSMGQTSSGVGQRSDVISPMQH